MSEPFQQYPPSGPGPGPVPFQPGPPPSSNLVWAILSLIFCFLPTGIVAVVYASQVNSKWAQGDQAGAIDSARKAKTWSIVSLVVGLVIGVVMMMVNVMVGAAMWSYSG